MPQEYTVASWKPWENDQGLIRDSFGNYKGTITFEEDHSEPIDATFKTQPSVGDKKYGTVSNYTTKAGNVRKGFKSAKKEQSGYSGDSQSAKHEWQPRDDSHIRAQWAIGQAIQLGMTCNELSPEAIECNAKSLFAMVDRIKGGGSLPVSSNVTDTFNVTDEDMDKPIDLDSIPF